MLREKTGYGFGTEISQWEAKAICPDGKVRKINLTNNGEPDTFFSIPANCKAYGKTVTGFVTVETIQGYSTPSENDPIVVKFVPYKFGKNCEVFNVKNA